MLENIAVAEQLNMTKQTVSKWHGRFVLHRLDGFWAPRARARRARSTTQITNRKVLSRTLSINLTSANIPHVSQQFHSKSTTTPVPAPRTKAPLIKAPPTCAKEC